MNPKIKKIKEFWKDFSSNKVAVVSLIIFMLILFVAVFAPLVSPTDPYDLNTVSIMNSRLAPFSEDFSGNYFLLGTDGAGRDMVSAISDPNSSPTTVTMGIRIFFSICTKTILFSDKPFERAKVI